MGGAVEVREPHPLCAEGLSDNETLTIWTTLSVTTGTQKIKQTDAGIVETDVLREAIALLKPEGSVLSRFVELARR